MMMSAADEYAGSHDERLGGRAPGRREVKRGWRRRWRAFLGSRCHGRRRRRSAYSLARVECSRDAHVTSLIFSRDVRCCPPMMSSRLRPEPCAPTVRLSLYSSPSPAADSGMSLATSDSSFAPSKELDHSLPDSAHAEKAQSQDWSEPPDGGLVAWLTIVGASVLSHHPVQRRNLTDAPDGLFNSRPLGEWQAVTVLHAWGLCVGVAYCCFYSVSLATMVMAMIRFAHAISHRDFAPWVGAPARAPWQTT